MAVKISSIGRNSIFKKHGVSKNDEIISINKRPLFDYFGFLYELEKNAMDFEIKKKGERILIHIERKYYHKIDCEIEEMKMMRCSNKCIFCFIDQNPPMLRKQLYFKDDDYRESLVSGNFITLSNLDKRMLDNIIQHKLSPLYVSLHAVEDGLRRKIFGRENNIDKISYLAKNGVKMHFQLVLMRNVNDKEHLIKTLSFAKELNCLSLGIVPVGLTKYRNDLRKLSSIDGCYSKKIIESVEGWKKKMSFKRIYLADEFFLMANLDIPEESYYGEYPQLENGIGMVRLFEEDVKQFKNMNLKKNRAILCGESFAKHLLKKNYFGGEKIYGVKNDFFGAGVTVTGLLTGRDILNRLKNVTESDIIIYKSVFNSDSITLDGYDVRKLTKESGKRIHIIGNYEDIKEHLT